MTAALWTHDRIQTLRVKAREGDKPALRLALMQSLASMDLHPVGMPPSAVFMIRYLNDPLPGLLTHKKKNNSAWRSALRDNLDVLYRQAARPVRCAINGDPPAVVFRDQAELLSCLLVDICEQRTGQHWWWRSRSFSSMHVSQRIRDVLLSEARYLPAVFSQLASSSKALEVTKHIEPQHAMDMLHVMLQAFSLENVLWSIAAAEIEFADDVSITTNSSKKINNTLQNQQRAVSLHAVPPWASLFSDDIWRADLRREQAALLGLARTIQQRPAVIRNRIFRRSLAEWWVEASVQIDSESNTKAYQERDHLDSSPGRSDFTKKERNKITVLDTSSDRNKHADKQISSAQNPQADSSSFDESIDTEFSGIDFSAPDGRDRENPAEDANQKASQVSDWTEERSEDDPPRSHTDTNVQIVENGENETRQLESRNEIFSGKHADSLRQSSDTIAEKKGAADPDNKQQNHRQEKGELTEEVLENNDEVNLHFSDTFIDTRLGGVIFLINLVQQLGLPACFSKDWKLDQQLSPWAMVDLLACALLGKQFASFYKDPLWRVLAKLDGRLTKLQIAKKFKGQPDYRISQDWFEWLQVDKVYWASSRKRLRIWTAQCVLVETTCEGDPLECCMRELQRYDASFEHTRLQHAAYRNAPIEVRAQLQAKGMNAELARFLSFITPFINEFLRRQLNNEAASKRELVREILLLDARIYLSASHIDLVSNIENTRFKLRCAGLDQNPGWLPEYGRVVLIHFS